MKLYVWSGGETLRNYATGIVVIAANTDEEAWAKLRQSETRAYYQLKTGFTLFSLYETPESYDEAYKTEIEDGTPQKAGYPIQPVVYGIDDLPVLVLWGGE